MKKIGLIGGMSWESTLEYYRIINERTKDELGGEHSAEVLIYSFDFADIIQLQNEGEWEKLEDMMVKAGKGLKNAGADFQIICANTMNKLADDVEERVGTNILHIGDATAERVKQKGMHKVGLIGTKFVMEGDFYRKRMKEKHGIDVIIPEEENREKVHDIIYNELCKGKVKKNSKDSLYEMIDELVEREAEGIILGCTELPLYLDEEEAGIKLFDTTTIHAEAAVEYSLSKD